MDIFRKTWVPYFQWSAKNNQLIYVNGWWQKKQKLSDDKEVVLFGTEKQMENLKENNTFEIKIGSEIVKPSASARNLGFYNESQLKSKTDSKSLCSTLWRMWQECITC